MAPPQRGIPITDSGTGRGFNENKKIRKKFSRPQSALAHAPVPHVHLLMATDVLTHHSCATDSASAQKPQASAREERREGCLTADT